MQTMMQNGLITVADAERILRRYLVAELSLAKQELNGGDTTYDVTSKLSRLTMSPPATPPRPRGISITESTDGDNAKDSSYFKELSYQHLSSTTVLLEPGKESGGNDNSNNDTNSVVSFSSQQIDQGNENGRLHDLRITDCSDTHFYLLQPFEHAIIAACTDCTIVIGAVAGVLQVVDCERTTITSAARRVIVSNSCDVVNYIFTPSPPLLVGDNRGCQFAPYNTYYDGLREDLLATGLAAALRSTNSGSGSVAGDTPLSPSRGAETGRNSPSAQPSLQCASNKWKVPVGTLLIIVINTQCCFATLNPRTNNICSCLFPYTRRVIQIGTTPTSHRPNSFITRQQLSQFSRSRRSCSWRLGRSFNENSYSPSCIRVRRSPRPC